MSQVLPSLTHVPLLLQPIMATLCYRQAEEQMEAKLPSRSPI